MRKKRKDKYDNKVKIKGTLDETLKVMVNAPAPTLQKRKGNKKQDEKRPPDNTVDR